LESEGDWGLGIGSWGSGISLRLIMSGETLPGHILSIPPVPSSHSPNRRAPIHPTTQRESHSPTAGFPPPALTEEAEGKGALSRGSKPFPSAVERASAGGAIANAQRVPLGQARNMGIKPLLQWTVDLGRSTSSVPISPLLPAPLPPALTHQI
jgi:hypothetical protein